ncbi:hypothetical protein Droror1_Dr00012003 [Drosera rotundifolia]
MHAKQEQIAAEALSPTEDDTVNAVDAGIFAKSNGFSSHQGYMDERRRPRAKSHGPMHLVQKDDEVVVTSQKDDITLELIDSLLDIGRSSLVTLVVTDLGRSRGNPSDGALMAYDLERRLRHKSCTANVLTEEEAEGFSDKAVEPERYGIARGEDQLDEVDIGGSTEASRPTFVSHNLTPKFDFGGLMSSDRNVSLGVLLDLD